MTVREMLSRIDSKELTEWAAFYSIEPFGGFRSDIQSGVIASTIANCNRSSNSKTFKATDFMPFGEHNKRSTMCEDDMKTVLVGLGKSQREK